MCIRDRFGTVTSLFAPLFSVMDHVIDWAASEGVPEETATAYVTSMFAAVCQEACGKNRGEVHYMATVSTPGGINMQALELLEKAGAFEAWPEVLKPIMVRTAGDIPKP